MNLQKRGTEIWRRHRGEGALNKLINIRNKTQNQTIKKRGTDSSLFYFVSTVSLTDEAM